MKLTKEQIKTLEDTFNYAVNALEDSEETSFMFVMNDDGTFEKFDAEKKIKEMTELFEVLRKNIEVEND